MKGQAAMEYLMTYGWALLVLAIVIGLIISSGIFSPSYLISEECNLGPKIPCQFMLYTAGGDTWLDVRVDNGFGYTIALTNVTMDVEGEGQMEVTNIEPLTLESGESSEIQANSGVLLGKGTTQVIRVSIGYYLCAPEVNPSCDLPSDPTALHTISGRIVGKIN